MFDTQEVAADPDGAPPVPLERLEAQICELAAHLTAATCRFLIMLADFDARRGWASWDMNSCAAWLSWKCQMTGGTAREHVRVARALRDLPVIRAEFGAGRLSYAKVRALTRIATPATEQGLAEIAGPMTGNQLERFARAHRQADDTTAQVRRRLAWRIEEDGSLAGTFRLPPAAGAVLLKALRAAAGDLEHPHHEDHDQAAGVSAETSSAVATSSSLADALLVVAESFLAGKVAGADDPEVYQVVVHVGPGALGAAPAPAAPGVSAETPPPVPADPADPGRCHVEDGPAISGRTDLDNLISLCRYHHKLVHDRGYPIAAARDGAFAFWRPDGTTLPPSPPLPEPAGSIEDRHDAGISEGTIIPPWYGERLDLDHAIYICLANARTEEERRVGRGQAAEPRARERVQVYEPEGWADRIRQYYDEHAGSPRGPVLVPVPV